MREKLVNTKKGKNDVKKPASSGLKIKAASPLDISSINSKISIAEIVNIKGTVIFFRHSIWE